jgi:hypothetical protein
MTCLLQIDWQQKSPTISIKTTKYYNKNHVFTSMTSNFFLQIYLQQKIYNKITNYVNKKTSFATL